MTNPVSLPFSYFMEDIPLLIDSNKSYAAKLIVLLIPHFTVKLSCLLCHCVFATFKNLNKNYEFNKYAVFSEVNVKFYVGFV